MGVEFKGKIMLNYSKEVEWQQGITIGIGFCVQSVLGYFCWMCHIGVMVSISEFQSSGLRSLPPRSKYDLLLNVWYSESFVKEKETPHFILVDWSALVVGGSFMSAWGRNSYLGLADISSVVCTWLNSRTRNAGWFVCIAPPAKS